MSPRKLSVPFHWNRKLNFGSCHIDSKIKKAKSPSCSNFLGKFSFSLPCETIYSYGPPNILKKKKGRSYGLPKVFIAILK